MNHKYGFHANRTGDDVLDAIVRIRPRVIKALDHDVDFWKTVRITLPDAFLIGRLVVPQEEQDRFVHNPAESGRAFAERVLRLEANQTTVNGRRLFDAWESYNEVLPGHASPHLKQSYDDFQVAFAEPIKEAGFEPIAMNFGTGNMLGDDFLDHFPGTLETYTYLGFHEYDWPDMWWLHCTNIAEKDEGGMWLCLRYRRIMDEVRKVHGDKHTAIITECGMTQGVVGGQDVGPWHPPTIPPHQIEAIDSKPRRYPDCPEGVPDDPVEELVPGRGISEERYWQSLLWYNHEVMKDDYVMAAVLFVVGAIHPWESFEHLGGIIDRLEEFQEPEPEPPLEEKLLAAAEEAQVIEFNPRAALQKRIFADDFVPNSPEFEVESGGDIYVGQRAEHLATGEVRVYYARKGEWAHVDYVLRDPDDEILATKRPIRRALALVPRALSEFSARVQGGATKMTNEEIIHLNREYTIFSWAAQAAVDPIPVARAEGVYLWDAAGRRYLDFSSQLMNVNIGHSHPKVIQAIKDQADRLLYAAPSFATQARGELGRMLAGITPGDLKKTFFTLGGAEANENALKLARMYTGRPKIVTRYRSYHGATYGAISASGDPRRLPVEPGIPGIVRVFDPHCYHCVFGQEPSTCRRECISHVEQVIQFEGPDSIAALLIEGVTGTSGLFVPPDDYWPRLREICDRYGILLIADEVMSGFGRTGTWFAIEHWNVTPDMITMAKGITSGYLPLGAVVVSDRVAQYFDERPFWGGLTYSGHPMSCAAAIATLQVYEEDGLLQNARRMEQVVAKELAGLKSRHPSVGDVRGIGLFWVIELVKDRDTHEHLVPWNAKPAELGPMPALARHLRERGLYTFVKWNWIFVVPPLCINADQLAEGLAIIDAALEIADASLADQQ